MKIAAHQDTLDEIGDDVDDQPYEDIDGRGKVSGRQTG
jgi:hypothetical protein